jgi:dTDP-4-amino-4,6-dideoxygalactose transaminase
MDVRSAPKGYRVPMSAPDITAEDIALVTQALHSKILSLGPFLDELEKSFAAYIGTRHAIAATNGTAGLHLCVRAAEIADGDEVITTPFAGRRSLRPRGAAIRPSTFDCRRSWLTEHAHPLRLSSAVAG